ncbi:sensor histidine kinase [Actinomadura algeriensis]|uniref:Signal transduction histidine kinase n=1 Tax=Actinomadura algeriensis TaxID=1679523 RepID=A0ABR9JWX3_9ACTN|nr:sensor histidine kinase [Actinomadura algeriensis]MBE1535047.1 signal transduction histidine kinase [Actinomadura algeriensis]
MVGPEAARAEDVWHRAYPLWEAYFAMVLVGTVALTCVDDVPRGRRAAAVGLLVLLGLVYARRGRAGLRADGRWPGHRVFAATLIVLFVPATLLAPVAATGLAALSPMTYMLYRAGRGLVVMAALCAGPTVMLLAESGMDAPLAVVIIAAGLASGTLIAVFVGRVGEQSRERARLIGELDRTRDVLAEVSREAGALAERERLAREIHDTIAQGFAGILMLLQAAEAEVGGNRYLETAARTAKENLAETRGLVAALAPPALDGTSLPEALRRLARAFGLPVGLRVTGDPRPLGVLEVTLLRVVQESLANVRRHAEATAVRVSLEYGDAVRLTIADDGRGFDPGTVRDGFGLRSMRGRVAESGGTFDVRSSPDGTEIVVEVPCSGC